jgi:predicted ABC-type ATPase
MLTPRIITSFHPEKPPADFKQGEFLIFLGGGKASGKSTVMELLLNKMEREGYNRQYVGKLGSFVFEDILSHPVVSRIRPILNARAKNNVKQGLNGSDSILTRLVDKSMDIAFTQRAPMIIDNHMDEYLFVQRILQKARAQGYETILVSPHIDAETYFERVRKRQERTGRPFNSVSGLMSHKGFAQHVPRYLREFDLSVILDNNHEGTGPVGTKPIVIATKHGCHILNQQGYDHVLRKVHLNPFASSAKALYPRDGEPLPRGDAERRGMDRCAQDGRSQGAQALEIQGHFTRKLKEMFEEPRAEKMARR